MPAPLKFVEVGRVAYAINGPAKGKILAIVDIIDYKRVLVEGPSTGVKRQAYKLNSLQLTKFKMNIKNGLKTKPLKEEWRKLKISSRFAKTVMAKNIAKTKLRKSLNDFDKFKMNHLLHQRSRLVKKAHKTIDVRKRAWTKKNSVTQSLRFKRLQAKKEAEQKRGPDYVEKMKELRKKKSLHVQKLISKRIEKAEEKRAKRADKIKTDSQGMRLKDENGKFIRGKRGNKSNARKLRARFVQNKKGSFLVKKNKKLVSIAHVEFQRDCNREKQIKDALKAKKARVLKAEKRAEKKSEIKAKKAEAAKAK